MSDLLKRLLEERKNVLEQGRTQLEAAEKTGDEFTGEARASWDAHMERMSELDARIKDVADLEERNKAMDEVRAKYAVDQPAPEPLSMGDQFRAWANSGSRTPFEVPAGASNLGEKRDLTSSSTGVIPSGFRNKLWEYAVETSGILQAGVDVLETSSGETIKLPRATAYSTVGAATEATAISESDPTLSSVDSTVTKGGYVVQVSSELLADSAFNLETYLAKWAGRELGNAVGSAAVTAALAAASAGATTAAGTAGGLGSQGTADRGFDYLITLFHSVLAPYRNSPSCSWVMADPTAAMVRKVKSTEGVYAWTDSVTVGQPSTILGKPVYIDTYVPDAAISVESIIFGDFSSLVTRIAGGFRFERSDEFAFNADLSTFRAIVRHGTVSIDPNALKTLTHAGS